MWLIYNKPMNILNKTYLSHGINYFLYKKMRKLLFVLHYLNEQHWNVAKDRVILVE